MEVVNFLLSDSTCDDSNWRMSWSRKVEKIYFHNSDSATDYYRAVKTGICLHLLQVQRVISKSLERQIRLLSMFYAGFYVLFEIRRGD